MNLIDWYSLQKGLFIWRFHSICVLIIAKASLSKTRLHTSKIAFHPLVQVLHHVLPFQMEDAVPCIFFVPSRFWEVICTAFQTWTTNTCQAHFPALNPLIFQNDFRYAVKTPRVYTWWFLFPLFLLNSTFICFPDSSVNILLTRIISFSVCYAPCLRYRISMPVFMLVTHGLKNGSTCFLDDISFT